MVHYDACTWEYTYLHTSVPPSLDYVTSVDLWSDIIAMDFPSPHIRHLYIALFRIKRPDKHLMLVKHLMHHFAQGLIWMFLSIPL